MIPESISQLLEALTFRSNQNLRPKNAQISYTKEMIEEYQKCKNDPVYFISKYVKVVHPDRGVVLMELYEYQERMIRAYHENKRVIFLTARQQGKCFCINTIVEIRNKSSGQLVKITIGELYEWQAFRRTYTDKALQEMWDIVSSQERECDGVQDVSKGS